MKLFLNFFFSFSFPPPCFFFSFSATKNCQKSSNFPKQKMTTIIKNIFDYVINGYWIENGDPRSAQFPFMTGLGPTLTLLSSYLIFVLVIGPRMMQNRKPYKLTKILLVYNTTMSLLNLFYFFFILEYYNYGKDVFDVRFPSFQDDSPKTNTKIWIHYTYWISKLIDLSDTIFFTLRKKQTQITGLHVYHHFSVPLLGWIYFRINALAPMMIAFALVNTFIHFVMYGYYALSAMGPRVQKWLWWKHYITQLQIGQFVFLLGYSVNFIIRQSDWPRLLMANNVIQAILYLVLFTQFYIRSYSSKPKKNILSQQQLLKDHFDVNNNLQEDGKKIQ